MPYADTDCIEWPPIPYIWNEETPPYRPRAESSALGRLPSAPDVPGKADPDGRGAYPLGPSTGMLGVLPHRRPPAPRPPRLCDRARWNRRPRRYRPVRHVRRIFESMRVGYRSAFLCFFIGPSRSAGEAISFLSTVSPGRLGLVAPLEWRFRPTSPSVRIFCWI